MVGRQSVRKKKRFRNKSRNKNVRKMRQIGGNGYESFPFTDRPLTLWERLLGRRQKQFTDQEMLQLRGENLPNTGGSNRRKSKKSKKSRKLRTRHKKNKKNY